MHGFTLRYHAPLSSVADASFSTAPSAAAAALVLGREPLPSSSSNPCELSRMPQSRVLCRLLVSQQSPASKVKSAEGTCNLIDALDGRLSTIGDTQLC